jgi:hypothetical protein
MDRTVVSGTAVDGVVWVFCNDGAVFMMGRKGKWKEASPVPGTAASPAVAPPEEST